MVMYDPPYCAICGGPFDHVELLDFAVSDENDQYRMELSYDSQVLSPAQSAVGLPIANLVNPSDKRDTVDRSISTSRETK